MLWCGFLYILLFGVYSASWICRIIYFAKFGKFSVIISLSTFFFTSAFILCFFWGSNDTNVDRFWYNLTVPWGSVHFVISLLSFWFADWIIYIVSSSPLLFRPLSSLFYCWAHLFSYSVFYLGYCIFLLLKFSLGSLNFPPQDFLFFRIPHWNIFMVPALKFLLGNSNICLILVLVSLTFFSFKLTYSCSWYDEWFLLKFRHLGFYAMRLSVLFKFCVLAGLIWQRL